MKCTILCIGDELLIGQTLNTNVQWISQRMNEIGIDVIHHITLSDDEKDIIFCLDNAMATSQIILLTGGLGPTSDDITKEVLCTYFGGKLEFNKAAFENIERIFTNRKILIDEATTQVAYLPDVCEVIPNKNGTAAGMIFTKNDKTIISMPGVPYEMYAMVTDGVIPFLKSRYKLPYILHKTFLTAGVGETFLADKLKEFEQTKDRRIKLAYLPSVGKVRLRLTIKGENKPELSALIDAAQAEVLVKIGSYVYGFDDDLLEAEIGKILLHKKLTLGTAESCTGGYIAHLITSISGSSQYFKGSIIAYANEIKQKLLQVNENTINIHGAVSEQTVAEMLAGALQNLNVDIAIAVSGVAGPNGGTSDKPVGTVYIGVASKQKQLIKRMLFTNNRERNIELTATQALVLLRTFLLNDKT